MAIINEDGHYQGSLGNFRFYVLNGQNIVATKGGPSARDIKNKASFAYTRAHNAEFGIVCKVSNAIFWSHRLLRPFRHPLAHQYLRSYLFRMFAFDTVSLHGQRELLFSEADQFFEPMQLTRQRYSEYVSLPVAGHRMADDGLTFSIPPANVNRYFKFPKDYDQVRWSLYVQGIKNISYDQNQKQYNFKPEDSLMPLTPVAHFDFIKGLTVTALDCSIPVQKDFHYLVFAVATFTSRTRPHIDPVHVASCIRVIPYIQASSTP